MDGMDGSLSRSEKKRRAKGVEELAKEILNLSAGDIRKLPCPAELIEEMVTGRGLKGPALKRQVKYIARELRNISVEPVMAALAEKKGSKLKEKKEFHELEYLRNQIVNEALSLHDEYRQHEEVADSSELKGELFDRLAAELPNLDLAELKKSAMRYAVTRKPRYNREVFRLLQAAFEEAKYLKEQENK